MPTPLLGKIKGTLVNSNGQSIQDITLGLWSATGTGEWKKINDTHIATKPDSSGAFIFDAVPAGTYVIANISSSFSAQMPSFLQDASGNNIPIDVSAGQTIDLGPIQISGHWQMERKQWV